MIQPRNDEIIPDFNKEKMQELRIDLNRVDGISDVLIVHCFGYIDTYNSNFFQGRMNLVFKKYQKVVFDLGGINYISSTGIGAFTTFLKVVKPLGGDIVLINVQPKVHEVFQLLGFTNFFTFAIDIDQAIETFSQSDEDKIQQIFPASIKCPICDKKLRAPKTGRFKCPQCKQIIFVDKNAHVTV